MEIRPLRAADWEAFREIRLLALQTEPAAFGSTYEREVAFTKDEWLDRVSGQGKEMFGVYDGDRIVGLTGIITDPELDAGLTAILVASFLLPDYRGRGLSSMMYQTRIDWARTHGISRVLVYVRATNQPSHRAMLRNGFRETGRHMRTWPDGGEAIQIDFELLI